MTQCVSIMKPKTMVAVKQETARGSVLVNPNGQRSVISNGTELLRVKRKFNLSQHPATPNQQHQQTYHHSPQPASVARRNARERNRVKQVNNGFATLRSHIPPAVAAAICSEKPNSRNSSASKKLSKVETLKMAVEYIRSLQQLLDEHGGGLETKSETYEEERYYSSSPETVVSSETQYYPNSPDGFAKSEHSEPDYYSPGRTFKTEHYTHFNPEVHDTLTAEFYNARSPTKALSSPERELPRTVHAFLPPRSQHRGSSSLSPPMSDACPSPTPSYASDTSSLHPGSSSGQLSSQMSRLSTAPVHVPPPVRRGSPESYESCEAMSPEDEELLDVISWWQQTN